MPLIVYCTAVLNSLSDSVSYITFLFSEWRIGLSKIMLQREFYRLISQSLRSASVVTRAEESDSITN